MDKKGELTSTQIIILVIAIIGFGIVLVALFLVNLGGYSAQDTCHLSVLTRATAPTIAESAIPLKCVTQKICLTEGSTGCEEEFVGEKDVEYVKLSGTFADKRRTIEETSANAMYDCWSMMGEGKLDVFGKGVSAVLGLKQINSKCVICSRVAIDKKVNQSILTEIDSNKNVVGGVDINTYMKTHQVPGSSLTYLQTFTDKGVSSYASVKNPTVPAQDENYAKNNFNDGGVSNRQMAFVFMQVKSVDIKDAVTNLALTGGTAAGAVFVSPVGKIAWAVTKRVIFTPWGAVAATVAGTALAGYSAYNAYQGQLAAAGYCGEFESNSDQARQGCSMVQGLDYHFNEINKLCGTIDGEL